MNHIKKMLHVTTIIFKNQKVFFISTFSYGKMTFFSLLNENCSQLRPFSNIRAVSLHALYMCHSARINPSSCATIYVQSKQRFLRSSCVFSPPPPLPSFAVPIVLLPSPWIAAREFLVIIPPRLALKHIAWAAKN